MGCRVQVATADFVEGARAARGIAVIIDVFRAFSLAVYAFDRGVERIVPVGALEQARALKHAHPEWLLVGERHAQPLPGFDCGNSPAQLCTVELRGRTLVHTTHAGTQGLTNALQAERVITGALVNAAAIVRYVQSSGISQVTLVRMGHEAREPCEEDHLCAEILSDRLQGRSTPDRAEVRRRLRTAASAAKFFDANCDWAPQADFDLCTDLDRFDFVLELDRGTAPPSLRTVAAGADRRVQGGCAN